MNKYEILCYMITRMHIMPTGLEKGKTQEEIDLMALETMNEMFEIIDFDKANQATGKQAKRYLSGGWVMTTDRLHLMIWKWRTKNERKEM